MSNCGDCGAYVRFLVLAEVEGKKVWSPPLTPATQDVQVVTKGQPAFQPLYRLTETYAVHTCAQGQARSAREQQNHAIVQDRLRQSQEAWKEALKRACPKCGAERRKRCLNLSDVRFNRPEVRETSWPHKERLPEGWEPTQKL